MNLTAAAIDVLTERARQVNEEKFDSAHDNQYKQNELVNAAITYARPELAKVFWPWERKWLKIGKNRRNLVKAAALLIAEIERLDRDLEPEKELV